MEKRASRWIAVLVGVVALSAGVALVGCGGENGNGEPDAGDTQDAGDAGESDADSDGGDETADSDCDSLQPERCELPWPSNLYLAEDDDRATGYQLEFGEETLVAKDGEDHASPEPYRRLDGYGVGTPLITLFPNVDTSEMASQYDVAPSVEDDSPIVWLEVDEEEDSVRRVAHFAELDARADDPEEQALFVRPAEILKEDTRYVVAFRDLVDTDGESIEPSEDFAALRDGETDGDPALEDRQERFDDIFSILEDEGVERDDLTLAWDFHTASSDALHGPMLHMREEAFEEVGEQGPELDFGEEDIKVNEEGESDWWMEIEGTIESPSYMTEETVGGTTAPVFNWGDDWTPEQNGTTERTFWLYIPQSARDGDPHGLIHYGHGLLGAGTQTGGGQNAQIANDYDYIFFGTSLAGMSDEDQASAATAVGNIDAFPFLADRLHQGLLEHLLLARAMSERLPEDDSITGRDIEVDGDRMYWSGISQGGIFGGSYMALSEDVHYGHLGVPGNNYSTLLQRSSNWAQFQLIMEPSYPSPLSQALALSSMQLLWEQTEPVSYLRHVTAEPFEGQDPSYVLLAAAKGDYQVEVATNEIAARSDMDIALMENYGRDVGLVDETSYPHTGSGLVLYDFGNPWPDRGNRPPDDEFGDPHGKPRDLADHSEQMVHFFENDGEIIDVCGGEPCVYEEE
ncbi:MAG: hypothetical protein ACOCV2_03530 [Persicimonas sp.]